MRKLNRHFGLVFIAMWLLLWGCSGPRMMMPTPNVYLNDKLELFEELDPKLKNTEVGYFT